MAFKRPLPEWNNPGVEPPQSKKDMGWLGREKPPAQWHNWFQHLTYEALKELQASAAHVTFGAIAPTSPDVNDLWVDTSGYPVLVLKTWDGTHWITVGAVNSVNGKTGDVELTAEDVGAASLTDFNEHLKDTVYDGVHGLMATAGMTIYVDSINGDDNNSGTQQEPLKTIGAAVSRFKNLFIDDVVLRIQLLPGTYQENVVIKNFHGSGAFELRGGDSLSEADNYVIDGHVEFVGCTCPAILRGVKVLGSPTVESAVSFSAGSIGRVENCKIDKSGRVNPNNNYGIRAGLYSRAIVGNNDISNVTGGSGANAAIQCFETGSMYLVNNTGSNNGIGIRSTGGIIFKAGTQQPNGVIEEETRNGGLITSGNAAAIVDMGSNTNGTYVRWGNGLQVCFHMKYDGVQSLSAYGALNTVMDGGAPVNFNWVFPAAFAATPTVVANFHRPSLDELLDGFISVRIVNPGDAYYRYITVQSGNYTLRCFLLAVGRWR